MIPEILRDYIQSFPFENKTTDEAQRMIGYVQRAIKVRVDLEPRIQEQLQKPDAGFGAKVWTQYFTDSSYHT